MTKKTLILAGLMLFIGLTSIYAQKIGFKAGYNFSKPVLSGDGSDEFKNATGVLSAGTYGIYINNKIAPFISLQLEGNYEPRGFNYKFPGIDIGEITGMDISGDFYSRMNYLTIPALVKVKVLMFHAEVGPYMSILLNANEVMKGSVTFKDPITGQNITETYDEENDIKSDLKGSDFGIAVGAGLTQNIGPIQFMAGIRYMLGMSNIIKEPEGNESMKHNVFTIYAGVAFGL
ncbi:MAG: porin family protein [Bacteroidales bacterium]|jgi:hypothetical protein|nr:porin family protein [Bacteroidales bacterium]